MMSTNEKNKIERESGFRPVFIGTTPGGSDWFAYKPEDVEGLRASLKRLWNRFEEKQREHEARQTPEVARVRKLSETAIAECDFRASVHAEEAYEGSERIRVGATFIEGEADFLFDCAEALRALALDKINGNGCEAASTADFDFRFAEVVNKRSADSLRKQAARIERAARRIV
jgi:ketopantoate reductase